MSKKKIQHALGVGQAVSYFTALGYPVFIPVSDISRYDLVVETPEGLQKIEVKTTSSPSNDVSLRTMGGNRSWSGEVKRISAEDCDFVFAMNVITGSFKLIPASELEGKATIRVR